MVTARFPWAHGGLLRFLRSSRKPILLQLSWVAERMKTQVQTGGDTLTLAELWTGILAGPFSWALDEVVRHPARTHACSAGEMLLLPILTIGALMACAIGFFCAWKASPGIAGTPSLAGGEESRRAMAIAGMTLSVGFALVILATAIPQWMSSACD